MNIDLKEIGIKTENKIYEAARDVTQYDFLYKEYSFGKRLVAIPKKQELVLDLQASRGPQGNIPELLKSENIKEIYEKSLLNVSIESYKSRFETLLKYTNPKENFQNYHEIGFRSPINLNFAKQFFNNVTGSDIIPLSIAIGKYAGYDVTHYDLMSEEEIPVKEPVDVIVAYHVLEHIHCPEKALKKIRNAVKVNSIMQVEVPMQRNEPLVRYAHLFSFEQYDLAHMINECGGWEILTAKIETDKELYTCVAI